MIFLSSHRPFNDDATNEYKQNQTFAFNSWLHVASTIVFFGSPEPQLQSPKTVFIPYEPHPPVRDMVDFCADQKEWCCLINADIWVSPIMRKLEEKLIAARAACASSWRHEFDPSVGIEPCERVDNGLDFFAATPAAWSAVFDNMGATPQGMYDSPSHLRFGAPTWDQWMLGALTKLFRHHFYNITKYKAIRHPIHGNRKYAAGVPPVHHIGACAMAEREL